MGTIYYGVNGEGRGHATRARAIVEGLRHRHRVIVYANGCAKDMLAPIYQGSDVEVRTIPGVRFRYNTHNKLSLVKSLRHATPYLLSLDSHVATIQRDMDRDQPEMVITDFEPTTGRAAARSGVPFLSVNHQHFLMSYDLSGLPWRLRAYAAFLSPFVNLFYSGQSATIVSSFFFPPLRKGYEHVVQVGTMMRPEVVQARPVRGRHLVAYLRRFATPQLLDALDGAGCEVRVYGLGKQESRGNLVFKDIDVFGFVEDLATSRGLVCTAGNQLVGEALYLNKPVLSMPEPGNQEQEINGTFLARTGCGVMADMERICSSDLRHFLDNLDEYRERIDPTRVYGNPATLAIINAHMSRVAPVEPVPRHAEVTVCDEPLISSELFGKTASSHATARAI